MTGLREHQLCGTNGYCRPGCIRCCNKADGGIKGQRGSHYDARGLIQGLGIMENWAHLPIIMFVKCEHD